MFLEKKFNSFLLKMVSIAPSMAISVRKASDFNYVDSTTQIVSVLKGRRYNVLAFGLPETYLFWKTAFSFIGNMSKPVIHLDVCE